MNYKLHYDTLIDRAKTRVIDGYSEKHHVIPKCMGGSNDADNLVQLFPREHYIAHQLLVKIYPKNNNLIYSVLAMTIDYHGHRMNNRLYDWIRRRVATARKRENLSPETLKKMSESAKGHQTFLGKKHTPKARKAMSIAKKGKQPWLGKKHNEESKKKISEHMKIAGKGENNNFYGKKHKTTICPHCNKEGAWMNMARWHFDNCKHK